MYAVALYETARDKGKIGDVQQGLQVVLTAWADKTFRNFFTSPRIPRPVKIKGMDAALAKHIPVEVLNFIKVLIAKGREPQFDNICEAFEMYRDQAENRVHAWVESGSEFSKTELDSLKAQLVAASSGKDVVVHYTYKPELLGGAKVRLGDKLMDNTLRTRLTHLAMKLR
jgi:F-type H+-transporting ATPase subunit delta